MKKLILTCSLMAMASVFSFAQTMHSSTAGGRTVAATSKAAQTPESVAQSKATAYKMRLNLTAEQYKTVYETELNFARQDQAARANGSVPGEGQTMQMNIVKDASYKSILTADQYTKYTAMQPKQAPVPGR